MDEPFRPSLNVTGAAPLIPSPEELATASVSKGETLTGGLMVRDGAARV
jgi:hypothetical protein